MQRFVPQLLVDGRLVPARSGRTHANVGPCRDTEHGQTPDAGVEDVDAAATPRAFETTSWPKGHAVRARCMTDIPPGVFKVRGEGGGVPAETGYFAGSPRSRPWSDVR